MQVAQLFRLFQDALDGAVIDITREVLDSGETVFFAVRENECAGDVVHV